MNDILSDLNPSKYKLKSNNNQSNSIQNNTTNAAKGDLLADLNSGKYKLKGSEPKEITQTEVQKGIEQLNSPIGILGTVKRTTETKLPQVIAEKKAEKEEQERWDSLSTPEKIADPFKTMGANIKYGDLGIEENQAWTEYRSKQDAESLAKAQAATKAREEYEASTDRIGKGNAFTKDFAQYLPQLGGQLSYGLGGAAAGAGAGALTGAGIGAATGATAGGVGAVPGALGGATTGALWGAKGGYVAGTAKYGYDLMAGSAYKTLLDMGVPNDVALELSGDEAIINSLIEGAGSVVDLISLGIGKIGTKGATTATKKVAQNRLLAAAKAYGLNLVSEPLEEGAQQLVSIGTQKKAAEKSGIERNVTEAEDRQSVLDSMRAGFNVAAITGLGNVAGNVATNKISQNIQQGKQNRQDLQNSLVGLEKMLPTYESQAESATSQENVARELPTMASQQTMQQTNRIEGETAQTGNMGQIAKNVENSNILEYNNDRGVENGRENGRETDRNSSQRGTLESEEEDIFSFDKYKSEEKRIREKGRLEYTPEEQGFADDFKRAYGKEAFIYDDLETDFGGGVSVLDDDTVLFGRKALNDYGQEFLKGHEVFEVINKQHKDIAGKDIKQFINKVQEDNGFGDVFLAYLSEMKPEVRKYYIDKPQAVAKEIIGDLHGISKSGEDINETIFNKLDANLVKEIQGKINDFEKQIFNIQADEQSAFSMPKNDVQTFSSSEAGRPYMDLNRYASSNKDSKVNKVSLTEIQNAINDIVPVKTGKFRQQAYGIYKTQGEIIRLKQMKDIPVALHELTHHLDKKYNLSSSDKAFKELENIAVVGKNATKQTVIKEGVAEFGRYYMTDKEYAKEIAPFYYDAFERALDSDPTMKAKVENIRQMVTNYLDQSPLNRLSSNIDYGDEDVSLWQKGKDAIIKTANTFRKNFVDDLDPLKKIVKEISGDKKLMTEEDAYKLLRLNNGVTGKVQVALEYGVLDKKGEKVSKSLKEILEPVANNQKEFVAYLTALRANDLQNRGIESGMLSRDVNDVIKMYKGNETFNNAAKELYNFQNKILETTLIDSGIITKDALDAYNKNNPHYVPFYRVMDENFKQNKSSKSKKPMKIKGSTRDIINPLESIIKNTYSYMQMAERNDTFKVLFDMANKYDGTGKWFDKVPTDMTATKVTAEDVKGILEQLNLGDEDVNYNEIFTTLFSPANNQKGNIVTVMQKGKPVHYEIMDKELFDILSPTIKGENFIVKLLSPASKALRVGATHTPEFVVRNPLRDTVDAAIYSKNKFIPVVDSLIGMFNVAGRTDLYYKWLQSGGSGSTYTNAQRPVLQKTLKGLTEGVTQEKGVKKALKGVGNLVKHPLRTYLDVAGSISNVAEEGTRVGEFRRALQQGKTEKEAALDSREITLDFSRGGKHAKDINKVVAFFNAELQGLDKMLTSFKDRPVATFVKSLAYVALPAMILRALQDEEELDKVPQWEKDEFFVFFVNGTPIKIPKSQGVGQIFGTIPERAIDYLRTHDKDAFDGLAQRLVTSYVPIDSTTSIFPNFFLPLIENTANYSFFKQQPIVNQSLQNRSPKYQYDENTSTLAKTIGGVLNYSPKKIDNIISGYAGNLGKDAANLIGMPIDLLSGNKKDNEYKSLNSKLKKVPLLKGFIASDYASKSLDKFYKSKDEVSTKYTDAKFNVSDGGTTATEKAELKYYKELNSLYNKAYNEIKELDEQIDAVTNGKGNDKYKETKIEQLKDKKDIIADKVEKQKELKGFNVKFNK